MKQRGRRAGERCQTCGRITPDFALVVHCSTEKGSRRLCSQCLNVEVARDEGLDKFEHVNFEPVRLLDSEGRRHDFHFQAHLLGPGISLEGFELNRGEKTGYHFQIIGEPEEDLLALLGKLIEKIRRGLALRHLEYGTTGNVIGQDRVVRGRIEWDRESDGTVPLLVIDGRVVTWAQFGHMLMSFEGWQFKLGLHDPSEEV